MNSITYTKKTNIEKALREILDTEEYRHEYAVLFDATIGRLWNGEIREIHRILTQNILNTWVWEIYSKWITINRPPCPINWPKKLNQAKEGYKLAMIAYLAQFGIHLTENAPCNYPPALLEALANYCEKNLA